MNKNIASLALTVTLLGMMVPASYAIADDNSGTQQATGQVNANANALDTGNVGNVLTTTQTNSSVDTATNTSTSADVTTITKTASDNSIELKDNTFTNDHSINVKDNNLNLAGGDVNSNNKFFKDNNFGYQDSSATQITDSLVAGKDLNQNSHNSANVQTGLINQNNAEGLHIDNFANDNSTIYAGKVIGVGFGGLGDGGGQNDGFANTGILTNSMLGNNNDLFQDNGVAIGGAAEKANVSNSSNGLITGSNYNVNTQ